MTLIANSHQLPAEYRNISLSHATLRNIDLIQSFMEFLDNHKQYLDSTSLNTFYRLDEEILTWSESDYDSDIADDYLNEILFDLIDTIAPDGCYFGAHIGDGSDFGFWQFTDEEEA